VVNREIKIMKYPIAIRNIKENLEYYNEVIPLIEESKSFLLNHKWCNKIIDGWLFKNLGHVLAVFLYEIENNQSSDDKKLWDLQETFRRCIWILSV